MISHKTGKELILIGVLCLGMSAIHAEEKSMWESASQSITSAWYSLVDTVNSWFEKKPQEAPQPAQKAEVQKKEY